MGKDEKSQLLGPHLLDRIMPSSYDEERSVPDAMQFAIQTDDVWVLNKLYEFKSGAINTPIRKLYGFSHLLSDMRRDTGHFPSVLRTVFPWAKESLPDRVMVPPDKKMSVIFVSTHRTHDIIFNPEAKTFRVEHLYVPPVTATAT